MFEKISRSIHGICALSDSERDLFIAELTVKNFNKGQFIVKAGDVCQAFYFVNEGSCRRYRINSEGEEDTLNLYLAGDWIVDAQSFTGQRPSPSGVQCFSDVQVLSLGIYSIHGLISRSPAFFKLGKLLELGITTYNAEHFSPEQRYLNLLNERPQLIATFPLKFLASYLGITPETLSRVRKRIQETIS